MECARLAWREEALHRAIRTLIDVEPAERSVADIERIANEALE